MRRGTMQLTPEELEAFLNSIDKERLPDALADRMSTPIPRDKPQISIFLSEDDAEELLDAADPTALNTEVVDSARTKVQAFLFSLRKSETNEKPAS